MTDLIEVKTADLVGEQLNWSVAIAMDLNPSVVPAQYGVPARVFIQQEGMFPVRYKPSLDWQVGGPLIESGELTVEPSAWDWQRKCVMWRAQAEDECQYFEHTNLLVSAMRAVVHAKLGDTVQVPKELMP